MPNLLLPATNKKHEDSDGRQDKEQGVADGAPSHLEGLHPVGCHHPGETKDESPGPEDGEGTSDDCPNSCWVFMDGVHSRTFVPRISAESIRGFQKKQERIGRLTNATRNSEEEEGDDGKIGFRTRMQKDVRPRDKVSTLEPLRTNHPVSRANLFLSLLRR